MLGFELSLKNKAWAALELVLSAMLRKDRPTRGKSVAASCFWFGVHWLKFEYVLVNDFLLVSVHVQQKHDARGTIQWRRPLAQALEKARSFCIDITIGYEPKLSEVKP